MKKFFRKVFLLALTVILIGGALLTVKYVKKHKFAVVIDKRNNMIAEVLEPGFSFIIRGLDYKNVSLRYFPINGVKKFNVKVMIPELADLEDDVYSIKFPVDVSYRVVPQKLNISLNDIDNDFIHSRMQSVIVSVFSKKLNNKFKEAYNPSQIEGIFIEIEADLMKEISSKIKFYGIEIVEIQRSGNVSFPGLEIYRTGLKYKKELLTLRQQNKLKREKLDNVLKMNDMSKENYRDNLKKMSALIKDNPLILKYIYIDKLVDSEKSVVPVDSSGYPLNLGNSVRTEVKKQTKSGEIDNLR